MLYFDHNATAPLLPAARDAWLEASEKFPGNPSSPHRLGSRAERALQDARERLAAILNCHALDLIWTSGATESNNLVFHHLAHTLPLESVIWISAIEHPSVVESARACFGTRCRMIPARRSGVIDLDWLKDGLKRARPALVAVMAANNETGVLQPWRETLTLCRQHGVLFFSDATQWVGKLPANGFGGGDFVSGSAHKFGGPRGVGFLKVPAKKNIAPLLCGGPQEDGRRAGTENVAGVLAMLAALDARQRMLATDDDKPRLRWREDFERALVKKLPGASVVGAASARLWNTVATIMPERGSCDGQARWVVKLDKLGAAVSTGSACASGRAKPSYVLAAMGCTQDEAGRMLRFSSGWETDAAAWTELLAHLEVVAHAPLPPG